MGGVGVFTREGEALVAVVEFLEGGGGMEVRRRRKLTVYVSFYAATPTAGYLLFEYGKIVLRSGVFFLFRHH